MPTKPVIVHNIPLKLRILQDGFEIICQIDGAKCSQDGEVLSITLKSQEQAGADHLYCYTIAPRWSSDRYTRSLAVFSGAGPNKLTMWPINSGVLKSPPFEMASGTHWMYLSAALLSEPRPIARSEDDKDEVNPGTPLPLGVSTTWASRRHVKTVFQGGED